MAEVTQQAKTVYETICSMLEKNDWHFTRHDEDLVISCGVRGDDLSMDILFMVHSDVDVVSLISPMPFKIAEDKRVEAALAVCTANYGLINGSFDYDLSDGEIRFRLVSSFRESVLSEDLFRYMLMVSAQTIDKYNDKFLMVSSGMLSVEQFIAWEQGN